MAGLATIAQNYSIKQTSEEVMGSEPLRIIADRIAPLQWMLLSEAISR